MCHTRGSLAGGCPRTSRCLALFKPSALPCDVLCHEVARPAQQEHKVVVCSEAGLEVSVLPSHDTVIVLAHMAEVLLNGPRGAHCVQRSYSMLRQWVSPRYSESEKPGPRSAYKRLVAPRMLW